MSAPPTSVANAAAEPTVLRSLRSAVLLDRRGDVELLREARGAPMEWGGVYGQHVRLTGRWAISLEVGTIKVDLPFSLRDRAVEGEVFCSSHREGPVEVEQRIVPLADRPGALRTLRLRLGRPGPPTVVLTSSFVPYLMPVLVEGIRPVSFHAETEDAGLRIRHHGFALDYRWDVAPARLYVDRASWRGGRRDGPLGEVGSEHELSLGPDGSAEVRFAVLGGLERDLGRVVPDQLWDPVEVGNGLRAVEADWVAGTPQLTFPDAPELELGYAQARAALRRLYSSPADGLTGLVAGYPWYSAIWGRDLAWMLPAVLWLGDIGWARASIETFLRFQASANLPLVAAEPGELPMQLAPGPIFLFGTSDTTLHYPGLVLRYLRHAGGDGLEEPALEAVRRAVLWGEHRTDTTTGLVRNGGEVERAERSEGTLTRVRYGIDAWDTTIWDSTDRRDHAIDVQVLWAQALTAALELGSGRWKAAELERFRARLEQVRRAIPTGYAWPQERYLADSVRQGVAVRRLRPNALLAVRAGLLSVEQARALVHRAAEEDLTTPWGVRTLSSRDPAYSPTAYHDGQVWTIATAWAADAAFAVQDAELGASYLRTIAARYRAEGGSANECYRGDRAEPYDSCFLLGFSIAPFLTTLFEGLWGLSVDARVPRLSVRPAFPPSWQTATIDRLRIGGGLARLRFDRGQVEVRWSGPGSLRLDGPRATVAIPSGGTGSLPVAALPGHPGA